MGIMTSSLDKVISIRGKRLGGPPPHRRRKVLDAQARRKKVRVILRKLDRDALVLERLLDDLKELIFSLRGELDVVS